MCYPVTNPVYIKDLMILNNPKVFEIIKPKINTALSRGVYIGDLPINGYIYEYRSTNISFICNYIKTLCILAHIFGDIFHDEIYTLRLEQILNDDQYNEIYSEKLFHWIFTHMARTFNTFVDDNYIFDELYIYGSEISLEVIYHIYDSFNENILVALKPYVNYNILIKMNGMRTVRWYPYLYDKIFQQLEDLYLPFY